MFFSQPLHLVTHTLTNLIPLMPYTPSLGSNGPYISVLGIHFTTRVAPTTVKRGHNNEAPKFRVDTEEETENITTLSPARKVIFSLYNCASASNTVSLPPLWYQSHSFLAVYSVVVGNGSTVIHRETVIVLLWFSVSLFVSTRNFGAQLLCPLLTVVGATLVVKWIPRTEL